VSNYFLDGDLFYLGRDTSATTFNLVLLETPLTKAVLVFTSAALAQQTSRNHHLLTLPHNGPRAKEEFFRAALNAGATEVWVDTDGLEPTLHIPIEQALDYIFSLKNQSACL
jgi:hypothetical protein